ncbi:MAG: carbohydrate ABC transporter permease [Lachnospiraceae bacterium]|nr:carbohydrate ABC transporter permease [Lachnospiraceae bacterium]
MNKKQQHNPVLKVIIYIVCVILTILSLMPFIIMMVNATRSTNEIQAHAVSLIPSKYLLNNLKILVSKSFDPKVGFVNSMIVSVGVTLLAIYFSTLTAYGLVIYDWRLKNFVFKFIVAVMMIPAQLTTIGFYQMVYKIHMTNHLSMLILPAIANSSMVFFMRQYMVGALPFELVQAARIDGAGEFFIFNKIALPIMKPAIATQAIFTFVGSWNNLFTPMILLTDQKKFTLPIMVSLLRGDIYRTEFGTIYLGLTMTALPLIIVYLILSKYIIAGVALGSVKG